MFSFDDEAQAVWDNWATETTTRLKDLEPDWQSIIGKHPALLAKLSLLFHLIEETVRFKEKEFNPCLNISSKHLKRGIMWMEYLTLHTTKIVSFGRGKTQEHSAYALLTRLHKLGESFTKHQLTQKGWEGLKSKEQRDIALSKLEQAGYIKSVTKPKRYLVHPDYRQQ